jgi:hypothetical protein
MGFYFAIYFLLYNSKKMKRFNKTIGIEIAIDMIAKHVLDAMSPDFKHREILTEAIISTGMHSGTLGHVLGAATGYKMELNYEVGDEIICSEKGRTSSIRRGDDGIMTEYEKVTIGLCTVVEIDTYRPSKMVCVKFEQDHWHSDRKEEVKMWVDHLSCDKTPAEDITDHRLLIATK